jgi:hypothetical protein
MRAAKNKLATKKADGRAEEATSATAAVGPTQEASIAAESIDEEPPKGPIKPVKDFAPRPSRFPITDVAMEPPTLSLSKSMIKNQASSSSARRTPLPISSAQKRCLELERDKVIKRYRQLKEERYAQQL